MWDAVSGTHDMGQQVQEGDYLGATQTMFETPLRIGSRTIVSFAGGYVIMKTGGCGALTALQKCILGMTALSDVADNISEKAGSAMGTWFYDKFQGRLDYRFDVWRNKRLACVSEKDGFAEEVCTFFPPLITEDINSRQYAKKELSPSPEARDPSEVRTRLKSIGRFLKSAPVPAADVLSAPGRVAYEVVKDKEAGRILVKMHDDTVGFLMDLAGTQGGSLGMTGKSGGLLLATKDTLMAVREMYGPLKDDPRARVQLTTKTILDITGGVGTGKLATLCVLGGVKTFGAVTLGCVGGALLAVIMRSDIPDKLGNVAGSYMFDEMREGFYRAKQGQELCIGKTYGFSENFCTMLALAADSAPSLIGLVTSTAIGPSDPSGLVADTAIDVGRSMFRLRDDMSPDSIPIGRPRGTANVDAGRGAHARPSSAHRVTAKDLNLHVRVDGNVSTTARSGDTAITVIGAVTENSGRVGGTHVTRIEGSVYNRGGLLEINPVRGCKVRRDGQCCVEIHRGRCVIDKYRLSKKKRKKRRCADSYRRSGSWCYEYSDRRHRVGR